MSKMNLSTYFECERPGKMDMCIIVRGIMYALKRRAEVRMHMEHIWYDAEERKVYFQRRESKEPEKDSTVNEIMILMKKQCQYAGDGTYEMMCSLTAYCEKKEYDKCLYMVEKYMDGQMNYEFDRKFLLYISMLCVAIVETVYLFVLKIQYY